MAETRWVGRRGLRRCELNECFGVLVGADDVDTDTLAAMTGGLLGRLAGDEWLLAPWRDVQDAAYLRYIAGRVVQGPAGAEQRPVETPAAPPSILTDLARNGDHEVVLGESTRVQATALPELKPLSKSITVRGWRLRTPEGQTLYVTRVEENRRSRRAGRSKAGPSSVRRPSSDSATSKSDHAITAVPDSGAGVVAGQGDALYAEFQRQLRTLLSNGPARPKRIEEALGLIPLRVRKWLERMEHGGEIERASRNPVTYALTRKRLL